MARYLYSELASLIQARKNCIAAHNEEWESKHEDRIIQLVKDHMPSGSGFDSGTQIDLDGSHSNKLVFTTAFHHMDEAGGYDGWTEHTVTVTPALSGEFDLRISGRNRNYIKEMMHQEFDSALRTDVTYDLYCEQAPQFKLRHAWEDAEGKPSECHQAWYVGDTRFTDYTKAREYAGRMMLYAYQVGINS